MSRIVIVGAGPAGAMLAYLLASRGVEVTLLERQHDFEREFRGEVLQPSGRDVFRQAGLEKALAAVPTRMVDRIAIYNHGRRQGGAHLSAFLEPGEALAAVSQPAMLEMLVEEASKFPSFRFERGAAMRDLIVEGDRVKGVKFVMDRQEREIAAGLVIGADGRASATRRHSGLEAVKRPQAFDIVWCRVPMPATGDAAEGACVFLGRGHFAISYPTYDGRLQMAWVIDKGGIGELRQQGIEHWVGEMAQQVSPELGGHMRSHAGDVTQPFLLDVVCDLMPRWTRPGLLLIGDAAHPMSPVGGQGVNLALRDAVAAANHLVRAAREGSSLDEAAQRVQSERMEEVTRIQGMQQLPPRVMFGSPLVTQTVLAAAGLVAWTGLIQKMARPFVRRLAYGVDVVKLEV